MLSFSWEGNFSRWDSNRFFLGQFPSCSIIQTNLINGVWPFWSVAEPTTGYVYGWDIYTGKMHVRDLHILNNNGREGIHWTTWDSLTICQFLNKGHHVYMDNHFSSPVLFFDLADANAGACGTLHKNCVGIPQDINQTKPKKGDYPVMEKVGRCQFIC